MPVTVKGSGGGGVTLDAGAAASATTLTLPNVSGTVALTASPTFSGTVTATTVTSPASTALTIQSAGTTAVTVDTSQNVGIGVSSPGNRLDVAGNLGFNTAAYVYSYAGGVSGSVRSGIQLDGTNQQMLFYTGTNERARIDSSGNLLVGTTSSVNGGSVISVAAGTVCSIITAATASTNMIVFRNGNGNVGSITTSGTATSYNTGSDYRLKHDVEPMTSGLATLAALNPVTYKWNADDSDGEGFIAHELAEVIPLAVTGEKNAVDADGNPVHQGVDYSKIVVHLVAAIQELSAKNDALEARLAALEAK